MMEAAIGRLQQPCPTRPYMLVNIFAQKNDKEQQYTTKILQMQPTYDPDELNGT